MRNAAVGLLGFALLCCAVALPQGDARARAPFGADGGRGVSDCGSGMVTLEKAPTDHAISIPKEKLTQYIEGMNTRKFSALRMIEGGRFSVNVCRTANAIPALVFPKTIEVWVVLEGTGTLTTGGKIVNGKIVGGVTNPLEVGDVEFIPANLPLDLSGVTGTFTWLNTRWDTDWPADSKLGAGIAPPAASATAAPAGRGPHPLEYAPTDHAVYIPKKKLDEYVKDMGAKNTGTLRMIEGGHFNVNIRHITGPSSEVHEITNDTWVMMVGSGIINTAYKTENSTERAGELVKRVAGTGVDTPANVGDVFFMPAAMPHGFGKLDGPVVAWLNIRWDVDWDTK